jgi:predicted secreted protein
VVIGRADPAPGRRNDLLARDHAACLDGCEVRYFFNGTVHNWQVIVPQLGTVEGPFQIASLEYAGIR